LKPPAGPFSERDLVATICLRIHRAQKGLRLYPADHPAARQTTDALLEVVRSYVDQVGALTLQVTENRLLYEGEEVYSSEGTRDNLAFTMFRDGIRFVRFRPGVEAEEITAVMDCLAHADDLADIEHDLTTAFWECDLQHIDYEVVDPFLSGGEGTRGGVADELRDTVARRLNELRTGSAPGLESGGGGGGGSDGGESDGDGKAEPPRQAESVDPDGVTLSEDDIGLIEDIVASSSDALADFALVLLEIIGAGLKTSAGDDALTRSLSLVVQQFLDAKNVDGLGLVVGHLRKLQEQGRRPVGFGAQVISEAATSEHLTGLIERMAEAPPEEAARIERLLGEMRSWIYPVLLEALTDEDSDKAVRKTALTLLHLDGGVPLQYLLPLMRDPRWYVVRNAVELATGSGDLNLINELARLLRHSDARVRREVVRSLDVMGGPRAAMLLARALPDEDSGVRILAVRSLRRHGNRVHFPEILAQVESREFEARPLEEVEALLLTFASLGQDAAVDKLNKLWKRRMFGNRSLPLRTAAVQALGAIASPAARAALKEAARSGEASIQRVATRALGEPRASAEEPRT
jgi:hypothetical protein